MPKIHQIQVNAKSQQIQVKDQKSSYKGKYHEFTKKR
jgi:hypothetical protein